MVSVLGFPHANVGDPPENKAEEGVKQRAHQRQEIGEEGYNFCDYEREDPRRSQDGCPNRPAKYSMVPFVAGVFENAKEDKSCRH